MCHNRTKMASLGRIQSARVRSALWIRRLKAADCNLISYPARLTFLVDA